MKRRWIVSGKTGKTIMCVFLWGRRCNADISFCNASADFESPIIFKFPTRRANAGEALLTWVLKSDWQDSSIQLPYEGLVRQAKSGTRFQGLCGQR